MKNKNNIIVSGVATLIGTTIGAGILGMPYVVSRVGFLWGVVYLVALGGLFCLVNLYLGEVILSTKGVHQLTGYAEKYLGRKGKIIMAMGMMISIYGALIAYLIGEGEALSSLVGIDQSLMTVVFWLVFAPLILWGVKVLERAEVWLNLLKITLILLLFVLGIGAIRLEHLTEIHMINPFIPLGVILFSFSGMSAMPAMREVMKGSEKQYKKALIIGSLIPICLYIFFALFIVGVGGAGTSEVATLGYGKALGNVALLFGNIFAVITLLTAFLGLGFALQSMYEYDYKLNHVLSWILALFLPLLIVIMGAPSFVYVLSLSGAFAAGISGIVIVASHKALPIKRERRPEYMLPKNNLIYIALIMFFVVGMVGTFLHEIVGV